MSMSRNFIAKHCLLLAAGFMKHQLGGKLARWTMKAYEYINTLERENSELREQIATLRRKFRRTQRRE